MGGWSRRVEKLFLSFRGLPFQGVEPGHQPNWRRQAIDLNRCFAGTHRSGEFSHSSAMGKAKRNTAGLSKPIGATRTGRCATALPGQAPVLASFNMRTEAAGFEVASYASGRWSWMAGAAVAHRDFRNAAPGNGSHARDAGRRLRGLQQQARVTDVLWRVPERHFLVRRAQGRGARTVVVAARWRLSRS